MKSFNFNDVSTEMYKNNCTAFIKHEGYEGATCSMEKQEIKKVMDNITDWNDLDQLYDANIKVMNIILKYDKLSMSNKRWNEREYQVREHYTNQVQMNFSGITDEEDETNEYRDLFISYGMMKTRNDGMWSFAHLDIFKATEMFYKMCKIRAHWLAKVEAGQYARKDYMIFSVA